MPTGTITSLLLTLAAIAPLVGADRVSLATAGGQPDRDSFGAAISDSGRYVLFASYAQNLVADHDAFGLYLRDRFADTTILLRSPSRSRSQFAVGGTASISGDGRFVAATMRTGFDSGTHAIVMSTDGSFSAVADSVPFGDPYAAAGGVTDVAIDDAGRSVAFTSSSASLVDARKIDDVADVYVRDLATGSLRCLSTTVGGAIGDGACRLGGISGNGEWVAFVSASHHLTAPADDHVGVYLANTATGAVRRVDLGPGGLAPDRDGFACAISGNGRYVAFTSLADNLVAAGLPPRWTVETYVFDRLPVAGRPAIELVSVSTDGVAADRDCTSPSISDDGRYIAFSSRSTTLTTDTTAGGYHVFVRDRLRRTTRCVDRRWDGALSAYRPDDTDPAPRITGDGRHVMWNWAADDIVRDDTNGDTDVFVSPAHDLFWFLPHPPLPAWLLRVLLPPTSRG